MLIGHPLWKLVDLCFCFKCQKRIRDFEVASQVMLPNIRLTLFCHGDAKVIELTEDAMGKLVDEDTVRVFFMPDGIDLNEQMVAIIAQKLRDS